MKRFSGEKGITLVALVITIIILLILAGVTISLTIGDSGLLSKATTAKEKQTIATYQELITLEVGAQKIYLTDSTKTFLENVKIGVEKQKEFEGSTYEIKSNSRLIITTKEGYVFIVKDNGEVKFVGDKEDLGNVPTIEPNDIEFSYPGEWTNKSVNVTISSSKYPTYDIEYSYDALNWMDYTGPVEVTENKTIHARLTNGIVSTNIYGTENIINIDKKLPNITTELKADGITTKGFTLTASVQDTDTPEVNASGLAKVVLAYKLNSASEWKTTVFNYRDMNGSVAGPRSEETVEKVVTDLLSGVYQANIEVYDVAGNKATNSIDIPLGEIGELGNIVYNPAGWTNGAVEVTLPTEVGLTTKYTLDGTVPDKDTGTTYTGPITVTENKTINYIYTDGINVKGKTETVSNIDTVGPVIKSEIAEKDKSTTEITTKITVQDSLSGLGKIVWYYKASTESSWRTPIEDKYTDLNGIIPGTRNEVEKEHTFSGLEPNTNYQFYAIVFDVAGNPTNAGSPENPQGSFNTKIQNVTGITLNQNDQTKEIGETLSVIATVTPDNASNKKVDWTSSDSNVATLSTTQTTSGTAVTVTCTGVGTTTITAMAADGSGISASFELTVKNSLTDIKLDKTYAEIEKNGTTTITATTTPSNAPADTIIWSTSNSEIVSIAPNGKKVTVTAHNETGSVEITASAIGNENIKATCTVFVGVLKFSYTGEVESVTLAPGTYKLECWGAQGCNEDTSVGGGKGGYSCGELVVENDLKIFVCVGNGACKYDIGETEVYNGGRIAVGLDVEAVVVQLTWH